MELDDDDFDLDGGDEDTYPANEQAAAANLETTTYLDVFEKHKEDQLQEGFESGYKDVMEVASHLGELLGRLSARARIQQTVVLLKDGGDHTNDSQLLDSAAKRFRTVMKQVNEGKESGQTTKQLLLELQAELEEQLASNNIAK